MTFQDGLRTEKETHVIHRPTDHRFYSYAHADEKLRENWPVI